MLRISDFALMFVHTNNNINKSGEQREIIQRNENIKGLTLKQHLSLHQKLLIVY